MASGKQNAKGLTDTEAETSMELDDSGNIVEFQEMKSHNTTKSVFNITLNDIGLDDDSSEMYQAYEKDLQEEREKWHNIYRQAVKKNKEKYPPVDVSVLSKENRLYLEQAPNMKDFIRGSVEFRKAAHNLEKNYHEEFREMEENVVALSKHHMQAIQGQNEFQMMMLGKK